MKRLGINGFQEIQDHPFFEGVDWEKLRKKEYVLDDRPGTTYAKMKQEHEGKSLDPEKQKKLFYGGSKGKGGSKLNFTSIENWAFKAPKKEEE